jgi:DNA polymerase elongation subunit (family B)
MAAVFDLSHERGGFPLITAFCDKIAELRPQLVTFNGNSFDLPVLRYRAMVHGVSALSRFGRTLAALEARCSDLIPIDRWQLAVEAGASLPAGASDSEGD